METLSRRYHLDVPAPSRGSCASRLAAIFAGVEHRPQDPANLFRIAIALEQRAARFFTERAALAAEGSADAAAVPRTRGRGARTRRAAGDRARALARRQAGAARASIAHAAPARPAGAWPAPMNAAALLLDGPRRAAHGAGLRRRREPGLRRAARARRARRGALARARRRARRPRGDQAARRDRLGRRLPRHAVVRRDRGRRQPARAGGRVAVHPRRGRLQRDPGRSRDDDTPSPWRERVLLRGDWRSALQHGAPVAAQPMDDDAPAFWCHSSGTSGKPKAVVHAHRFARQIEQVSREALGIVAGDRLFASSKLFFSYPQTNSLFAGLKLGATRDPRPAVADRRQRRRHRGGAAPDGAAQRAVAVPQPAARGPGAGHRARPACACACRPARRCRPACATQWQRQTGLAHRQRLRRVGDAGPGDARPRRRRGLHALARRRHPAAGRGARPACRRGC